MPTCPSCQRPAAKRDGRDSFGRQRYACRACGRDFTEHSTSAFAGYRWPPDVILLAVRWSLSHPLSATSVMELLAERGIDVSKRTVLRWVQAFGPLLAAEVRKHRRPLGTKCYVDEVFFFRGKDRHYLYRAVDEHGQVIDVLFREHRSQGWTKVEWHVCWQISRATTGKPIPSLAGPTAMSPWADCGRSAPSPSRWRGRSSSPGRRRT